MPQKYKVYINDKAIIFGKSKTFLRVLKNHVVLNVPSPKKIKHLIDDFLLQEKIKDLLILTPDSSIPFKAFKQDYKLIHAAGGLVKNENGEMLFIFRNGKWDLPKGHIEKSEKPRNAAIREVKEETGLSEVIIRKKIGETYHTYEIKNRSILKLTNWYEMTCSKHEPLSPQNEEGITEVKWIDINEMDEVLSNTYPSLLDMLSKYQKKKE